MAKRKHSRALFEVISKSNQYARPAQRRRTGLLASARRWLGGARDGNLATAPVPAATAPLAARAASRIEPLLEAPAPEPQRAFEPEPVAEIAPPSPEYPELDAGPRPENLAVNVDPERRQIALRMSYTMAIVGGFAVVVIVALSIIVGQHLNRSGVPLLAQTTTDELRKGPAHREVLDPPRRTGTYAPPASSSSPEVTQVQPNRPTANGGSAGENRPATPAAPPSVAGDGKRYISLNYVIVQSYPESERKMAEEACAFLNKEGVSCTIETGVKGYLPITVVGLQGFDKQSSPAFKAYVQRIQQLSGKYTVSNRSYKAFTPVAKKWDKQD
jgi:hypothetical protein